MLDITSPVGDNINLSAMSDAQESKVPVPHV
jgi:hypothetical protein